MTINSSSKCMPSLEIFWFIPATVSPLTIRTPRGVLSRIAVCKCVGSIRFIFFLDFFFNFKIIHDTKYMVFGLFFKPDWNESEQRIFYLAQTHYSIYENYSYTNSLSCTCIMLNLQEILVVHLLTIGFSTQNDAFLNLTFLTGIWYIFGYPGNAIIMEHNHPRHRLKTI